jgi:hypothetical protein
MEPHKEHALGEIYENHGQSSRIVARLTINVAKSMDSDLCGSSFHLEKDDKYFDVKTLPKLLRELADNFERSIPTHFPGK